MVAVAPTAEIRTVNHRFRAVVAMLVAGCIHRPALQSYIEGRIIDPETHEGVWDVSVMAGGACVGKHMQPDMRTGMDGWLRFELLLLRDDLTLVAGKTLTANFEIDRSSAWRPNDDEVVCGGTRVAALSDRGASQADVDEIARVVLERFATFRNTVPEFGGLPPRPVAVDVDIEEPERRLSPRVLRPVGLQTFTPTSRAEIRAAKDAGKPARFIDIPIIDSNGTCAVVFVDSGSTCSVYEAYDKRSGHWKFFKRLGTICS